MTQILYAETDVLCILLLILVFSKSKLGTALQSQLFLFKTVLVSNCILFLVDILWIYVESSTQNIGATLNWFVNMAFYVLSGLVSYLWFLYSETVQNSNLVSTKKNKILCAIPMILLMILTITSVKTRLIFYVDDYNLYQRGSLYLLQVGVSWGYVLFTAIKAWILAKKTKNYYKRKELSTLDNFAIVPVTCGMIQIFFPYIPIFSVGTTFGCMFIFITMQENMISLDALTGLNNRNKLMQHLTDCINHYNPKMNLYLIMMDLDRSFQDKC